MRKRTTANPKRQLERAPTTDLEWQVLARLAEQVTYEGNPVHKRNPGDFGLEPFGGPRQGKTLCDGAKILRKAVALGLLKEGLRRGLISVQRRNDWPQNVWALSDDEIPLEAMLTNRGIGEYHGYPLQSNDPLTWEILKCWKVK